MSFGENIVFYRKKLEITQEELAERLYVSRQTISRWENDSALPDVEMLIRLCNTFGCDMDTLVRGDASKPVTAKPDSVSECADDVARYDKHISPYTENRVHNFRKKLPWLMASATLLIFLGIIFLITTSYNEAFDGALGISNSFYFFLILSVVIFIYVYAGILNSKFNVKEYNDSCIKQGYALNEDNTKKNRGKRISDALCAVIMLTATAIFLLLGFSENAWHSAWIAFPIGGICCGICSIIFDAIFRNE